MSLRDDFKLAIIEREIIENQLNNTSDPNIIEALIYKLKANDMHISYILRCMKIQNEEV